MNWPIFIGIVAYGVFVLVALVVATKGADSTHDDDGLPL